MHWRHVLPELLVEGSFRTQSALVDAIHERTGIRVDQSTVSRELHALGAEKADGAYRLPPPPEIGAPVHFFGVTGHGCTVVVKTDPAFANVLAQAVDDVEPPGVLGTIAGDDTVFIAVEGEHAVPGLRRLLSAGEDRRRPA